MFRFVYKIAILSTHVFNFAENIKQTKVEIKFEFVKPKVDKRRTFILHLRAEYYVKMFNIKYNVKFTKKINYNELN